MWVRGWVDSIPAWKAIGIWPPSSLSYFFSFYVIPAVLRGGWVTPGSENQAVPDQWLLYLCLIDSSSSHLYMWHQEPV